MKTLKLVKWYVRGLVLRLSRGNGTSYNAFSRWARSEDGRKNGRHSKRMERS